MTTRVFLPTTPNYEVTMPTNMQTANRILLKVEIAIVTNLACLHVFMYERHTCIQLAALLDHKLADGTEYDFIQIHKGKRNLDGLNGTPAVTKLLYEMIDDNDNKSVNYSFGYILLWSDIASSVLY